MQPFLRRIALARPRRLDRREPVCPDRHPPAAGRRNQSRSSSSPPPPTVSSSTCGAEEVTLKVNGRARPVRSLRFVPLPGPDPAAPAVAPVRAGARLRHQHHRSRAGAGSRSIVDHESIKTGAERNAMNAVIRFVKALGPRDHVAFGRMPRGGIEIDYTTDHLKIVEALRKFVGTAPREETDRDRACRSRELLQSLRNLLEGLAPLNGPKIVTVVSSGVLNPRRDAPLNAPPGQCEIRTEDFQNVRVAAAQARAHVFVVQPDNLVVESARTSVVDPLASRFAAADEDRHGLQSLAGSSAGEFMQIVGPEDNNLLGVAKATAGYYVATFDPDPSERNAATHRLDVSVTRDQVKVRARPEVIIPRAAPQKGKGAVSARDMLADPTGAVYRGLPLRAVAYPSASEGGKVKILSVLEPVERDVKIASAVFGLIDMKRDKLVVQWTANARELATQPIVTAGEAPPGPYRLRVAAVDSTGRQGTVEYEVMATLTDAKPLTLSAIALGTSSEGGFTPKLVFGGDQAATTYFEVYGKPPTPESITIRLEVAASADDRALQSGSPAHHRGASRSLAHLRPGARVAAGVPGAPHGRRRPSDRLAPPGRLRRPRHRERRRPPGGAGPADAA